MYIGGVLNGMKSSGKMGIEGGGVTFMIIRIHGL